MLKLTTDTELESFLAEEKELLKEYNSYPTCKTGGDSAKIYSDIVLDGIALAKLNGKLRTLKHSYRDNTKIKFTALDTAKENREGCLKNTFYQALKQEIRSPLSAHSSLDEINGYKSTLRESRKNHRTGITEDVEKHLLKDLKDREYEIKARDALQKLSPLVPSWNKSDLTSNEKVLLNEARQSVQNWKGFISEGKRCFAGTKILELVHTVSMWDGYFELRTEISANPKFISGEFYSRWNPKEILRIVKMGGEVKNFKNQFVTFGLENIRGISKISSILHDEIQHASACRITTAVKRVMTDMKREITSKNIFEEGSFVKKLYDAIATIEKALQSEYSGKGWKTRKEKLPEIKTVLKKRNGNVRIIERCRDYFDDRNTEQQARLKKLAEIQSRDRQAASRFLSKEFDVILQQDPVKAFDEKMPYSRGGINSTLQIVKERLVAQKTEHETEWEKYMMDMLGQLEGKIRNGQMQIDKKKTNLDSARAASVTMYQHQRDLDRLRAEQSRKQQELERKRAQVRFQAEIDGSRKDRKAGRKQLIDTVHGRCDIHNAHYARKNSLDQELARLGIYRDDDPGVTRSFTEDPRPRYLRGNPIQEYMDET